MWGARGGGRARLHVSSPGGDRGESVGLGGGRLRRRAGRGRGRERLERTLFLGRGVSEEGIVGFNSGMDVQRHCRVCQGSLE